MSDTQTSDVLERFFRYVQIDTTSNSDNFGTVPSTRKQFDLANLLGRELRSMGARDVFVSENAYVTAWIPAGPGSEGQPRLGLIAHIDTSEQAPGAGVKPHIVHYEGGELVCGERNGKPVSITPELVPALGKLAGQDLICSDGTTLLGSDDKAGVAEIMALAKRLIEAPELPHPEIGICFCPDEEIGHGAELLDIDEFGCVYAYTVDGSEIGEMQWECFNAATAKVTFEGRSTHPGDAKGRMINAVNLFTKYQSMLPHEQRPEHAEGYDGFIHVMHASCTVDYATAIYIIRDHSAELYENKIELMRRAADFINAELGEERVNVEIEESYRNMAEMVLPHPELIENAKAAFVDAGVTPIIVPIRGGTDGSQLSFRGLPCPNLSSGGFCFHSINEFIPVGSLERMVDVLQALAARFA